MGTVFVHDYYVTQAIQGLEDSGLAFTNNYVSAVHKLLTEALAAAIKEEQQLSTPSATRTM